MVFLRLIIKVYPREQLSRKPTPQAPDDQTTKPASFLLALPNPEEISLGQLANLIRSKWIKLRPNAEPLDIKKLLDDNRDSVDLDVDMTVADVWVNKARARKNEDDQDGVVRVVQRPAPYAPVRFPSVDQDWGVGGREGKGFKGTFETIEEGSSEESEEESEEEGGGEGVNVGRLVEVEAEDEEEEEDEEEDGSEEESGEEEGECEDEDESENENEQVNGTVEAEMETVNEGESEEQVPDNDVTMEDSLPEMRVLKRKLSPEELEPKKQARLEPPNHAPQEDADNDDKANGTPLSSPLGAHKRDADRAPSFSGLNRRLSFTERPASSHGLGLGITKSPPRKKPFLIADIFKDSTQSASVPDDTRLSPTSVPPSSAPIRRSSINQHPSTPAKLQTPADKVKQLQSALRKDSPAERTPERRSVSFSGEDHVFPTVPAPKSVPQTANKEEKKAAKSGVLPEPASQETEDQSEEKAEAGLFAEVNMEANEYEEELLRAEDLDPKGDYVRKLKLASKRWQVMINNKNKTRTREIERYHNAIRDLKTLNRELLELNEFNAPPTQRPRSQTPNGTPATRKLSRPETTCSQGRKSEEHWNVEILTPKPNSKKLMSKDVPASQKSRKSEEGDSQQEEQVQGHWEVEIRTPRPNGTPLKQSESKKLSSPKRPPTPPEESESEEESSSEEETESAVLNSVTKPSPPAKVSKPEAKPVSESGLDSEEEQSGSDEEGSDSEEAEEETAEAAAAGAEAAQNDKTPTTTKPNPESQPSSKPDPQSDEETDSGSDSDSDSESEASDASEGSESEKENQLPKPTPQTKADLLRRTSLNLPSSQNQPSNDHPTSSQSTPTGPRAPRQTLKGLLRKQREEQSEKARAKAEAEKLQRQRQQPHKDIFSGPSDSESEESDSSSDSGADAGDILSSGTVGKLRPAFGRK